MNSVIYKNKESLINNVEVTASITKHSDANLKNVHKRILTLLVELRYPPGSSKELYIQVTEEGNPSVLLTAVVTDSDYQALCSSQGLLKDFSSFPHHLESHIKQCVAELDNDDKKQMLVLRVDSESSPPDLSKINSKDKVLLEAVELGNLRHNCLFSIGISPASVEAKLSHISSSLRHLKSSLSVERREAQEKEANLSSEINRLRESIAKRDADMQQLRDDLEQQRVFALNQEENFRRKEIAIKDKIGSDYDRKLKNQRRDIEMKYESQLKKLHSDIKHLNKDKKDIFNERNALERSLSEMKFNYNQCCEDLKQQTEQLANLRSSNKSLKRDLQGKTEFVERLNTENMRLQADYHSTTKEVQKLNDLNRKLQEKEGLLKTDLEDMELRLNEETSKHKETSSELKQGLRIISKFKKQIESLKLEAQVRSSTLEKYEKSLSEKNTQIHDMEISANNLLKDLEEERKVSISYSEQLEEAKRKIVELERNIDSNENMISFLNKRLSEAEMTGAIVKKAPLSEGYLRPASRNVHHLSGNPAGLTTSTPLSGVSAPHPHFAVVKGPNAMSEARMISNISRIPEENAIDPHGDFFGEEEDVPVDLGKKYVEPTRKNLPSHGLLRSSAFPPKPVEEKAPAGPLKARGRGASFPRRGVKTKGPQSNYFLKRNV